jgi:ABC-type polysaccharide transport system permease subunit
MLVQLLRWVAVPAAIIGGALVGTALLYLNSAAHDVLKGTVLFGLACLLTGFVPVLLAGWVAPRHKAAVQTVAMIVPFGYWLVVAYYAEDLWLIRGEVIAQIIGVVVGGGVAWWLLDRMIRRHVA